MNLTTFADPVCPEAVLALEKRRASLDARTRVLKAPTNGRRSKLQQKILDVVVKAGLAGIASSKIAANASCNIKTVSHHIRALRAAGLVEPSRNAGVLMRWGPPGTWAHHEAARGKASMEKQKRSRRKADKVAAVAYAERPMMRRLVNAADCPPMVKPRPSSVFEVARWAA